MGSHIRNIFRLSIKELRSLGADPILLILIVYTFTYAVYAVATGVTFEVEHASIGIVDEDRSALSRGIASAFLEPYFKRPVEISSDQIDSSMDGGRFVFIVDIPPRFESDLIAGKRPALQVNADATAMSQAGNGVTYIQNIVAQEVLDYVGARRGVDSLPINLVVRTMFNPNLESRWFTSVMQVIENITILAIVLTGAALIRELEHGTVEHLLVMPVTPGEIVVSKILANGLVIVLASILSLWFVVHGLLGVPVAGSMLLFAGGTIFYLISVAALGILLATFTGSMAQFSLLVMPVLISLNLLSGSTTPLESMPVWLQNIMLLSPTTHFVRLAQAVLYRGAGLHAVWRSLAAIAGISLAFFGIALLRFRAAIVQGR